MKLLKLMTTVKKISTHLVENCGYHGVNLLNANGKSAGQSSSSFSYSYNSKKK